jgi:hypothetical protein
MPRQSKNEEMGAGLEPDDLFEMRLVPKGWALEKKENFGKGSHKYYWWAKKGNKVVSSRYLQNVFARMWLIQRGIRVEEDRS